MCIVYDPCSEMSTGLDILLMVCISAEMNNGVSTFGIPGKTAGLIEEKSSFFYHVSERTNPKNE